MTDRPDFNALIGRLRARSTMGEDKPLKELLLEAAKVLEQAHEVLKSVPEVVRSNRAAAQAQLTTSVVAMLTGAADQYDSGELSVTTASTALRACAAGMASALQEVEKRNRPGAPKRRSNIVGLHS